MQITSTPTPQQLKDYYQLRYESFSQRLNRVDFHSEPDETDKRATTLVVMDDKGQCIAGIQICFRQRKQDLPTLFEQDMTELTQLDCPYAEMLRLAIKLDHPSKSTVMEFLMMECVDYIYQAHYKTLFFYTSRAHGVLYQRIFRKMNLTLNRDAEFNTSLPQPYKNTISVLYTCDLATYKRK